MSASSVFSTGFNLTQPFTAGDVFVGRFSQGGRIFGADATTNNVYKKDGSFFHKLDLDHLLHEHIVQLEDFRGHPVEQNGETQSLALVTVVTKPKDRKNGLVGWHAGAVLLEKGADKKVEATHFWQFSDLIGKNATPVRVSRMPSGNILVDFDVRLDSNSHMLSRYSATLHEEGTVDMRHIQDNTFPRRQWNQTMAGTGGGFIPYGLAGEDGEPLFEVGLVHGQKKVRTDGMNKRKYCLGVAVRNRSGGFVYLSENPDISPEDIKGKDLRNDVIALYSTHRGNIIMNGDNQLELVALINRGDSKSHIYSVLLPQKAQDILLGKSSATIVP